ncbi:uncharacterized protein LOC141549041 [Sminthopsis crassicaudata]|uniref:uncharacterized protein LOC141549041 n=1 Tax=Sminthopsis crassicaudata TaxID=9301 RepID=UPI003D697603
MARLSVPPPPQVPVFEAVGPSGVGAPRAQRLAVSASRALGVWLMPSGRPAGEDGHVPRRLWAEVASGREGAGGEGKWRKGGVNRGTSRRRERAGPSSFGSRPGVRGRLGQREPYLARLTAAFLGASAAAGTAQLEPESDGSAEGGSAGRTAGRPSVRPPRCLGAPAPIPACPSGPPARPAAARLVSVSARVGDSPVRLDFYVYACVRTVARTERECTSTEDQQLDRPAGLPEEADQSHEQFLQVLEEQERRENDVVGVESRPRLQSQLCLCGFGDYVMALKSSDIFQSLKTEEVCEYQEPCLGLEAQGASKFSKDSREARKAQEGRKASQACELLEPRGFHDPREPQDDTDDQFCYEMFDGDEAGEASESFSGRKKSKLQAFKDFFTRKKKIFTKSLRKTNLKMSQSSSDNSVSELGVFHPLIQPGSKGNMSTKSLSDESIFMLDSAQETSADKSQRGPPENPGTFQ